MTLRAVTYARVSGDDRGKDGRNLTGQLDMCREYALQQGWIIVDELAEDDRGASGASFELPQLDKVRLMARNGEFDVLVVREIDRLSRKLAKQLVVEEELNRMGVQIAYVLADYDDTPEGRLSKHIRATIAEFEREKIMERMIRGRLSKVRAGHVLIHSTPPYGYKATKKDGRSTLTPYEPEARIVRSIFDWYINGDNGTKMTIIGIANKLTNMGVPTRLDTQSHGGGRKKNGKGVWSRSMIGKILKNEVYIGTWHYRKDNHEREEWIAINVPALVSGEEWSKIQKIGEHNKTVARASRKHEYLLTGHIRCGLCGCRMNGHPGMWVGKNSKGYNLYYRCTGADGARVNVKCRLPQFRLDQVDTAVWAWVCGFLTNPLVLEQGIQDFQTIQETNNEQVFERITLIEELLEDNKQQLQRVLDLYLEGGFSKDLLVEKKARLEHTIQSLQIEKSNLNEIADKRTITPEQIQDIQDFSRKIVEEMDIVSCNFKAKRQIIELLKIEVICMIDNNGEKYIKTKCILGESHSNISMNKYAHSADV